MEKVISEELPKLAKCFSKPVVANVSGFSVEEYQYTCEKLDKEEQVGLIEVNVSCPNVHGGGMSFGTSPESAAKGYTSRQRSDEKAGLHKAVAQCD